MLAAPTAHWPHVAIQSITHTALPAAALTAHVRELCVLGGYMCGARHFVLVMFGS